MFTIYHMIGGIGIVLCPTFASVVGYELVGISGAIVGGTLGLMIGVFGANYILLAAVRSGAALVRDKSSAELRRLIHEHRVMVNFALLELRSRGEDIHCELGLVIRMLESDSRSERGSGWAALSSAFPDLAEEVSDYHVLDSSEVRKGKIDRIRDRIED